MKIQKIKKVQSKMCIRDRFTDYISKPFTKDQIEEKLRKILEKNNVEILRMDFRSSQIIYKRPIDN